MKPLHAWTAVCLLGLSSLAVAADTPASVTPGAEVAMQTDLEVVRINAHLGDNQAAEKILAKRLLEIGTLQVFVDKKKQPAKIVIRTRQDGITRIQEAYFVSGGLPKLIVEATKSKSTAVQHRYYLDSAKLMVWQSKKGEPLLAPTPERQAEVDQIWKKMKWYLTKAADSGGMLDVSGYDTDLELE